MQSRTWEWMTFSPRDLRAFLAEMTWFKTSVQSASSETNLSRACTWPRILRSRRMSASFSLFGWRCFMTDTYVTAGRIASEKQPLTRKGGGGIGLGKAVIAAVAGRQDHGDHSTKRCDSNLAAAGGGVEQAERGLFSDARHNLE